MIQTGFSSWRAQSRKKTQQIYALVLVRIGYIRSDEDQVCTKVNAPKPCSFLHLPKVKRITRNENSQQILENIGYGLGATP